MGTVNTLPTQPVLWELFVRSISAQLTGASHGAVHWVDAVSVSRPYDAPRAGGYWTSRCGVGGHFTACLHRRVDAPWCRRCAKLPERDQQPVVKTVRMEEL